MPDDLPWIIEYKVGVTVRMALPRRPVTYVSSSGCTDSAQVCPQIPRGAVAWRLPEGPWRSLGELPKTWLPYLQRS